MFIYHMTYVYAHGVFASCVHLPDLLLFGKKPEKEVKPKWRV